VVFGAFCLGLGLASTVRRSPWRLLLGGVGCLLCMCGLIVTTALCPSGVRLVHGLRHRLGRGGPDRREDTHRRAALAPALDQEEPDSAVCCLSCHRRLECNRILRALRSEPLSCAIGWARLARSDVDQLFMGLACRRASVYVRCVLTVVRRPLRCLMDRRNGRYVVESLFPESRKRRRVGGRAGLARRVRP
jgi:hypothetical protein